MIYINENEWIYYYFCKCEDALETLIQYYRPMVISLLKQKYENFNRNDFNYYEKLIRADELLVECLERFYQGYPTSFTSFYRICFINLINSMLREIYTEKRKYLNFVSLDSSIKDRQIPYEIKNLASSIKVHEYVMNKLDAQYRLEKVQEHLNELEKTILELVKEGYTTNQIGEILNMNPKKVRYRINKIKKNVGLH